MANQQRGIQTVELSGEILKLICNSPKSLSLSEISEYMALPPGSVYKYLNSLLRTGLLKRNENSLEFEAGSLSLRLGLAKIKNSEMLKQAQKALTKFADHYQANIFISMWSKTNGATVVFYKQTGGFFHIGFRLGIRLSLRNTASGRVFATYLSEKELDDYIKNVDLQEKEILISPELKKVYAQIKSQEYSYLMDSPTPGISSFSVPVLGKEGELMMALTAFTTSKSIDLNIEKQFISELKEIAKYVSEVSK